MLKQFCFEVLIGPRLPLLPLTHFLPNKPEIALIRGQSSTLFPPHSTYFTRQRKKMIKCSHFLRLYYTCLHICWDIGKEIGHYLFFSSQACVFSYICVNAHPVSVCVSSPNIYTHIIETFSGKVILLFCCCRCGSSKYEEEEEENDECSAREWQ